MQVTLNGIAHDIELNSLEQSIILNQLWNRACDARDKGADTGGAALDRAHLILAALFAAERGEQGASVTINGRTV